MKVLSLGLMPHKRRERFDAHLNLIPLIDILSVEHRRAQAIETRLRVSAMCH